MAQTSWINERCIKARTTSATDESRFGRPSTSKNHGFKSRLYFSFFTVFSKRNLHRVYKPVKVGFRYTDIEKANLICLFLLREKEEHHSLFTKWSAKMGGTWYGFDLILQPQPHHQTRKKNHPQNWHSLALFMRLNVSCSEKTKTTNIYHCQP